MDSSFSITGVAPPYANSELVIALVAPVGTNIDRVATRLRKVLDKEFDYELNEVRISRLLGQFGATDQPDVKGTPEFVRLMAAMHLGNTLRLGSKRGEFLALGVARKIQEVRDQRAENAAIGRVVHLVRSLKHPDEVRALRRIYGTGFFLVGIIADEDERKSHLEDTLGCEEDEVKRLLERDRHEEDQRFILAGKNYGQQTRNTFQLSDAFVRLDDRKSLKRLVDLIFGNPFLTPSLDEHAMFLAFSSALRSGDLSRQVGAVVVSEGGDVIATGANDVPRAGGGLYWCGDDDERDHVLGHDSNATEKEKIVVEILETLAPEEGREEWITSGKEKLKACSVADITEYGRAVHAEMEALISCTRTGSSPRGGTLYSTTFPCHNCAKHIIAAGVTRVVYVEPYPKSHATTLYSDSIRLASGLEKTSSRSEGAQGKRKEQTKFVVFEAFRGVGPKRFYDLFSMSLSSGTTIKRKSGTQKSDWKSLKSSPRIPMFPNSYIDREKVAVLELSEITPKKDTENGEDLSQRIDD